MFERSRPRCSVASYSFRHCCSSYRHLVDYLAGRCWRNTTLPSSRPFRKTWPITQWNFFEDRKKPVYPLCVCVCLLIPKLEFECRWTLPPWVWQVRWPTCCICGVCLSLSLYRCSSWTDVLKIKFRVKTVKSKECNSVCVYVLSFGVQPKRLRVWPQFRRSFWVGFAAGTEYP